MEAVLMTWILASVISLYIFYRWNRNPIHVIPTIGPSAPLLSYYGTYKLFYNAHEMVQEGYNRYKGSAFKLAMMNRWLVVISGPQMIEELQKYSDDLVSFSEGAGEIAGIKWAMGHEMHGDPYHVDVIRSQLIRQLGALSADVQDEIDAAYQDYIPAASNHWINIPCMSVMRKVIARTSNRIFVGKSKCRDLTYLQLAIEFTMDIMKVRNTICYLPMFLKPFLTYLVSDMDRIIDKGMVHFQDTIIERQTQLAIHGDNWSEKPNDMLMWLIEEAAEKPERSMRTIVQRLLATNFAAIHTSTNGITHAIYHLAANPEFLQPLREEVEAIVKVEGWNKGSISNMRKIDSFLRESLRINGVSCISVTRKTLKDITFSNGTFIPAGTYIAAAASATHSDEDNYLHPEVFDPFRFSNMRDEEGAATKYQYVSTSTDYIPFGLGKHACPGRFFAANELKMMLAYTVLNYDMKLADEGVRPENVWFGLTVAPALSANVLFRKRVF